MFRRMTIYGLGIFASKILVFLLVPIYTRYLDPSDYGYYDVLITMSQMVVSITFLEIWSGALRFMFDYNDLESKRRVSKSILFLFAGFSSVFLIGLIFMHHIMEIRYLQATIIYGITYAFFQTMQGIARGYDKNILYIISGLISTIISCLLSIIFIVFLKLGIEYLIYSLAIGYLIATLTTAIYLRVDKILNTSVVDWKLCKSIILFCAPLLLNTLAFSLLGTFDKNYILNILGNTESGYYAVATKFSTIIAMIASIFQLAWQEQAYSVVKQENRDQIYSHLINQYLRFLGLLMPIAIIIVYFTYDLLIGTGYGSAKNLIPVALVGAFVSSYSGIVGNIFSAEKQTNKIFTTTIVGAIVNVILIIILTPSLKSQAANISLLSGFCVIIVVRTLRISKYVKIKLDYKIIVLIIILLVIASSVYFVDLIWLCIVTIFIFLKIWILYNKNTIISIIRKLT